MIVPAAALPFATPSTNQESVPVPVIVAVNVCDCDVVTAARPGARVTLAPPVPPPEPPPEPLPEPPPEPGVELEELPPQEISPGEIRAKAQASNRMRRLIFRPPERKRDEGCFISIFSIKGSPGILMCNAALPVVLLFERRRNWRRAQIIEICTSR